MIDRRARDRLAEAMRALAAGLISNDAFENDRLPSSSDDAAIREIYSNGAWGLYSDHHEYRLRGRYKLNDKAKEDVARWVLFLKTDLPYEWPVTTRRLLPLLANVFTLGLANKYYFWPRFRAHGEIEVWPFVRRADYEAALNHPPYLRPLSQASHIN